MQRVEAAWGDMDAPVSISDTYTLERLIDNMDVERLSPDTAKPDNEPTLF